MIRDARRIRTPLDNVESIARIPLETPSHNGEYRGVVQVREVPYGVCGRDALGPDGTFKARNERLKSKTYGRKRDPEKPRQCAYRKCKKILPDERSQRYGRYCDEGCHQKSLALSKLRGTRAGA